MSELKCCELCGAFHTCKDKKECCPECENFDPIENTCLVIFEKKKTKPRRAKDTAEDDDVDPDTFLFEDDEEFEEEVKDEGELNNEMDFDDDEW